MFIALLSKVSDMGENKHLKHIRKDGSGVSAELRADSSERSEKWQFEDELDLQELLEAADRCWKDQKTLIKQYFKCEERIGVRGGF